MKKKKQYVAFDDCPIRHGKHCISWDGDFAFSDYIYEGEGIVSELHCLRSGTEIEFRIPLETEENKGDTDT